MGSEGIARRKRRTRSSSDGDDEQHHRMNKCSKKTTREITDEEISAYLAKKAQKEAMKVAKKLIKSTDSSILFSGYSNDSNPFKDSNLNERFVWKKKIRRDVDLGGVTVLDNLSLEAEKKRCKERIAEIEKVKKRREERAIEKERREEELAFLARERAKVEFEDLEKKKEEDFQYVQSKLRSEIRLREGRAKPIDIILSKYLNESDIDEEEEQPAYMVFKSLSLEEIEELRDEIVMHIDCDTETKTNHLVFWEALLVVCDWEISEARKKAPMVGGLHSSIQGDVRNYLEGKTHSDLELLKVQIESQMRSGAAKVVEYWEGVLKYMGLYMAKAFLKEFHGNRMGTHLKPMEDIEHDLNVDVDLKSESEDTKEEEEANEVEEEEAGSFSPQLLHCDDDDNVQAIDPVEDKAKLEFERVAIVEEQRRRVQEAMTSESTMELKAMKAMGSMEEGGGEVLGSKAEVMLNSEVYWWHDKYRPRKPKYFNRVHSGYEWNKYNRTHYDHDNPPPKFVQGYKFNIFYPDLVDKSKAPTYTIEKDGSSNGETCIIRFHAGPPYEDIAFRIVDKEWEKSQKKGFKATFERGIMQVYFNFKRYSYRR